MGSMLVCTCADNCVPDGVCIACPCTGLLPEELVEMKQGQVLVHPLHA